MRFLLSTIGSRGDVQPLVALALELQRLGHEARLCVPPDFRDWIEGLGFAVTTIGPELRTLDLRSKTPEELRAMVPESIRAQFECITAAADGCDAIVAATAIQAAARSVAELLGIGYVFAAYCPFVLPSPHHAQLHDAARFRATFGDALNTERKARGLAPLDDPQHQVFTDRPWLAADPLLAPWPGPADAAFQTGAWLVHDERPLSPAIERFLAAGEPPVYFGFGSTRGTRGTRGTPELSRVIAESARAAGRRAIVLRGWANLSLDEADCLVIDEVNQQALFERVAAVVHHGGAGTTTAATLAGAPQVVVPQMYDQPYFADRVRQLGIGAAHAACAPGVESLTIALSEALRPEVVKRARWAAMLVRTDGASIAAQHLSS